MSAAIQRLERLLARVQQRRQAPRTSEPAAVAELRSLPTPNLPFSAPPPPTGRVSKVPVPTPLEESMEQLVPVERPREALPNAFAPKPATALPESEELVLDDFEPAESPTIQPGPMTAARVPVAVAPAAAPAVEAPAPITAATARIVPVAPVAAASPVATVTQARRFEPKNFGELLDLSLALRPSK